MKSFALAIDNLTVAYNNKLALWNITVGIPHGILLGIAGPNGAGKSTFIKSIVELVKPLAGTITVLGSSYAQNRIDVAYIPQRIAVDWDFPINVLDVVIMGRYGRLGWFKRPGTNDINRASQALHDVGLENYAHHAIHELSCGQQQRVFLARALTQEAMIYLLDEPFAGVDAITEKVMIQLFKKLRAEGKTIIVVHHDIQTLQEYFDWLLLLNVKHIAFGPTEFALKQENLYATYKKSVDMHPL